MVQTNPIASLPLQVTAFWHDTSAALLAMRKTAVLTARGSLPESRTSSKVNQDFLRMVPPSPRSGKIAAKTIANGDERALLDDVVVPLQARNGARSNNDVAAKGPSPPRPVYAHENLLTAADRSTMLLIVTRSWHCSDAALARISARLRFSIARRCDSITSRLSPRQL